MPVSVRNNANLATLNLNAVKSGVSRQWKNKNDRKNFKTGVKAVPTALSYISGWLVCGIIGASYVTLLKMVPMSILSSCRKCSVCYASASRHPCTGDSYSVLTVFDHWRLFLLGLHTSTF